MVIDVLILSHQEITNIEVFVRPLTDVPHFYHQDLIFQYYRFYSYSIFKHIILQDLNLPTGEKII